MEPAERRRRFAGVLLGAAILALSPAGGSAVEPPATAYSATDVGGLEARSAALVWSGQEGGELPVAALVVPWPGVSMTVLLVVEIDGRWLLEHASAAADRADPVVEVHAYGLDEQGALLDHLTQAFVVERRWASPVGWRGVRFVGGLDLPPGSASVRLLVRRRPPNEAAEAVAEEALALRVLPVVVPDPASVEPWLSPPLVAAETQGWTLVRQEGWVRQGGWHGGGGEPDWLPAARPVVSPGQLELLAVARGEPLRELKLLASGLQDLTQGDAQIKAWHLSGVGSADAETAEKSGIIRNIEDAETNAWHLVRIVADLPPPPGDDPLRPLAVDLRFTPRSGESASPGACRIWLVPGSAPDSLAGSWTDLPSSPRHPRAAAVASPTEPATLPPPVDESLAAPAADRYRRALRLWAAGRERAARVAVRQLEHSLLAAGGAPEDLARTQLSVAMELGRERPALLLPLFALHRELYAVHRSRRDLPLAAHARRLCLALVELYGRLADGRRANTVAALALVDLAGALLEQGERLAALELLEQALDQAPEHPRALLLAGALHEVLGQGERTVTLLKRLEATAPNVWEARLRLGINLLRGGAETAGGEHLRACLDPAAPRWVRTVAIQELAARAMEDGRWPAAEDLLRRGLAEDPAAQRFYLQLSAVLESQGRHGEAREALRTLEAVARRSRRNGDGASPRLRYSRLPMAGLETDRQRLEELVEAHRPALAAVLGVAAGGGEL